jgi:hypothetical protein
MQVHLHPCNHPPCRQQQLNLPRRTLSSILLFVAGSCIWASRSCEAHASSGGRHHTASYAGNPQPAQTALACCIVSAS